MAKTFLISAKQTTQWASDENSMHRLLPYYICMYNKVYTRKIISACIARGQKPTPYENKAFQFVYIYH